MQPGLACPILGVVVGDRALLVPGIFYRAMEALSQKKGPSRGRSRSGSLPGYKGPHKDRARAREAQGFAGRTLGTTWSSLVQASGQVKH